MIRIALTTIVALVALAACGGGDDDSGSLFDGEPTATPAGSAPDATSSPPGEAALPEITSLCDLVTEDDVDDALSESATLVAEFKDVSCAYATDSGSLNIERGSQKDFEVGIFGTGDLGEPVEAIGEQAAWFAGSNTLSVGKGDFYFQLRMNFPDLESAAQLEAAKDIAAKAVERIP